MVVAARVAALLRAGGVAHLALTYDGATAFEPPTEPDESRLLTAYHYRMDRAAAADPTYGGSTAGRRVADAVRAAGLEILHDAPAVWRIAAADGPDGRAVLERLIRYVVEGALDVGTVSERKIERWRRARCEELAAGTLTATVEHRDVLARKA